MRDHIKQVMANTFQVPISEIPDDASVEEFPKWDSLGHLELMLALELEFGVQFPALSMLELLSLEAIEEYLHQELTSKVET